MNRTPFVLDYSRYREIRAEDLRFIFDFSAVVYHVERRSAFIKVLKPAIHSVRQQ